MSNPFTEAGFCDDWSYGHVAMTFAQTGRMHYNGWGNPLVLFQTLWAFPWIRLFGFSLPMLAVSMLPFALAFVVMVYAVGREIGLRPPFAAFAAMAIGTCPMFVVLAGTFMTDVCGCFFAMLCIYLALKNTHAEEPGAAIRWLWWLVLAGLVGGANRQIVWVAPLSLIPYLCWLRRRDSRFIAHAAAAYAICIGTILVLLHFFGQPFSPILMDRGDLTWILRHHSGDAMVWMIRFALLSILLAAPVLCCFLPLLWRNPAQVVLLLSTSAVVTLAALGQFIAPYGNSMLTFLGPFTIGQDMIGRPPELTIPTRIVATLIVNFFVLAALLGSARGWTGTHLRQDRVLHVFSIFSAGYLTLMIPGAFTDYAYDKYMLPIIALLMLEALRRYFSHTRRIPVVAWLCLAVFAAYAVASTHDYFAGLRTRIAAANVIEKSGVPRNHISVGFEYDAWTEVSRSGHVRVSRYQDRFVDESAKGFWFEFWDHLPTLQPDYVVLNEYPSESMRGGVLRMNFDAWIAPHRRSVVVWRRSDLSELFLGAHVALSSVAPF